MPIINSASIGNISAGIGDLYAAKADKAKAAYDITEGKEYDLASQLALQNEQFTQMSTAIKDAQTSREIAKSEGATSAAVAGLPSQDRRWTSCATVPSRAPLQGLWGRSRDL